MTSSNNGVLIVEETPGILRKYETGEYRFIPLEKKAKTFKGVSKRTKQILLVIGKMKNEKLPYNKAVKKVAKELDVTTSTVYDKLQRSLQKTSDEIQEILDEYVDTGDFKELQELLLDHLGEKKRENDEEVIIKFFKGELFIF